MYTLPGSQDWEMWLPSRETTQNPGRISGRFLKRKDQYLNINLSHAQTFTKVHSIQDNE